MRHRKGKEVALGNAMDALVKRLGGDEHMAHAGVMRVWDEIVGPEVARRTLVRGLRSGELLVDVDSPVWGNELGAMSGQIADALNEHIGQTLVRSVRFNVSRSVSVRNTENEEMEAATSRYQKPHHEEQPLTQEEMLELERQAAGIEDEELREAVVRAAARDIARSRAEER